MYGWNGTAHMGGMWLWWLIGIALVVLIVWMTAKPSNRNSHEAGSSAEDILKRRYAKGEIDKEEYETRLQDLRR